ncbi:MAG: ShlB/FhaC/HecB family hemolysin secretion/activation protein [Pseudomonadota bacterium]
MRRRGALLLLAWLAAPPLAAQEADQPVLLRRVLVNGNTVLPAARLEALTAPWQGRQASAADLEMLRQDLTRLYTDSGYINSGVGQPRLDPDGVLEFDVQMGRLTELRLRGLERLDQRYVRQRLAGAPDAPLNLNLLRERFQLLLADPLFARMNARLIPGVRQGEAIFDVEVQRARPFQLRAFANNYRPLAIGANVLGLAGVLRNLSGQGDLLDASVQGPLGGGHGTRTALGWQLPLGQDGSSLVLRSERGGASVIEEPTRALDIRSRLGDDELGVSHTVRETLSGKLSAGASLVWRANRTSLLGQPYSFVPGEPNGDTRERLWRFWIDAAWRSSGQVLAARSSVSAGRNNLQRIDGLPAQLVPAQHFWLWQGQWQYGRQLLDNGAQLLLRGAAQYSPQHLLALDALAVGGVSSVRGFRENQLVRDRGAYLTLECDYPLLGQGPGAPTLMLMPFLDAGQARNVGAAPEHLASLGLAGRLEWRGASIELAWARRLTRPVSAAVPGASLQDRGIHLQLAYTF